MNEGLIPRAFVSEEIDIQSRTVSGTEWFTVEFDGQFSITRETETSTDEVFGELGYWPETVLWTASSSQLHELLAALAKVRDINTEAVLARITEEWPNVNLDPNHNAEALGNEHAIGSGSQGEMHAVQDIWVRIGGIRCPFERADRDGIEFLYDASAWTIKLYCDGEHHNCEFDYPEQWKGATLAETFESIEYCQLPWTLDELRNLLVEHDANWRFYIQE